MEYFGCLWILCNNGLLKKRTDIESGSGFLRDWWLHLWETQRIFHSLSISHCLYPSLSLQRSLAFSLSHWVSSGIGGSAPEKVKLFTSLFSLSFRLSHFLLFFLLFSFLFSFSQRLDLGSWGIGARARESVFSSLALFLAANLRYIIHPLYSHQR